MQSTGLERVRAHYEVLLSEHYTWTLGGSKAKHNVNLALLRELLPGSTVPAQTPPGELAGTAGPRPARVALDLGCGSGFQTIPLLQLGFHVVAIDASDALLSELRGEAEQLGGDATQRLHTVCGDLLGFGTACEGASGWLPRMDNEPALPKQAHVPRGSPPSPPLSSDALSAASPQLLSKQPSPPPLENDLAAALALPSAASDQLKALRPGGIDAIVCMGDTLTHLGSLDEIDSLVASSFGALAPGGRLVLQFRDLTQPLFGTDRFIPVRSDERTVFTCFLEWEEATPATPSSAATPCGGDLPEACEEPHCGQTVGDRHVCGRRSLTASDNSGCRVRVHDLVHVKKGIGAWELCKSWYVKLGLTLRYMVDRLRAHGFVVELAQNDGGMELLVGRKPDHAAVAAL
ncbi:hypothetical protein HK105_206342 [Polyrhizophydium stewartii]|uniref:Methyltransferase domain-containing protein n=1 Tax=Polyrhizophydium stewartii TaxID=2732419 RepID=A0ABR4N3M4_9FUNG